MWSVLSGKACNASSASQPLGQQKMVIRSVLGGFSLWRVYLVTTLSFEYFTGTTSSLFFNSSYGRERSFEVTCLFQLGRVHVLLCSASQASHNQQYRRL